MHINAVAHRGHKRALIALKYEFWVVDSSQICVICVFVGEQFSGRSASVIKGQTTSLLPQYFLNNIVVILQSELLSRGSLHIN